MGADDDTGYLPSHEYETSGYDPVGGATAGEWETAPGRPEWAEGGELGDVDAGGTESSEDSASALELYNEALAELLAEDPDLAELLTDDDLRSQLYAIAAETAGAGAEGQAE